MIRPVLICQGFHRAFIDRTSALFSEFASMRRDVCERLLRHARSSAWVLVHSFLDTEAVHSGGGASIQGFAPMPSEHYFRQKSLSAFRTPAFDRTLAAYDLSPLFLISLGGIGAISATLLDAIERRLMINVVVDAIADCGDTGVPERDRLAAIETLARSCDCAATSAEVLTLAAAPSRLARDHFIRQAAAQ